MDVTEVLKVLGKAPTVLPPSVKALVIVHGLSLVITLMVWGFGFPVFPKFQLPDDDVRLSGLTVLILKLSRWTNEHTIIPIATACALVLGDALFYMWLRHHGQRAAVVWFWCVLALLIFLIVLTAWTMCRTKDLPVLIFPGAF
jgi:hypothetical protein